MGAEEGIGADGDGGGGPAFRLVYSGGALEYLMTYLSPACRYRFRVRRLRGTGHIQRRLPVLLAGILHPLRQAMHLQILQRNASDASSSASARLPPPQQVGTWLPPTHQVGIRCLGETLPSTHP